MELTFTTLDLKLHEPFTISRGTQLYANNVQLTLSDGEFTGTGAGKRTRSRRSSWTGPS